MPSSSERLRNILAKYDLSVTRGSSITVTRAIQTLSSQLNTADLVTSAGRSSSSSSTSPRKRLRESEDVVQQRKAARADIYGRLHCLTDRLLPNLDIVFCGINPGVESATKGAHYAHPTNQFWRGIHAAGLTTRLIDPLDEAILPVEYSLGLTDMIQRPTAEAAELTKADFYAGAPILLEKLTHFRPRVVCLVGKCIWDNLYRTFMDWTLTGASSTLDVRLHVPKTDAIAPNNGKKKRTKNLIFEYGLQPFVLSHSPAAGGETLIFVIPSTSGLVAVPKYPAKVALLKRLKESIAQIKAGSIISGSFSRITLSPSPCIEPEELLSSRHDL